ncbi:ABC transporter substrate-binding protein [Paenibacillus thermoaerophilus]|uniref:ABC transporter substrate-binding protein n=1 Tax=Paenibacillus thermoaerophilus TaxID=1215385 RepID=A0ABW2UZX9_9BACL|nr:extracellular solute-binding protein [Paenibacillus thermoaerophilus]TMV18279.1 extracellular solute-binding protein [Paenibacillus thermoaerophilus]
MKKRRLFSALLVLWLVAGCTGCLGESPEDSGTAPAQPLTLKVLYATVEAGSEAVVHAARHYTRETGVNVQISTFPYNSLQEKVFTELSRMSGEYDLIAVDTPWVPKIIRHLEPLTPYLRNAASAGDIGDFIAKLFLDTSVFDKDRPHRAPIAMDTIDLDRIASAGFDVWSLPIQSNVLTVSYRKDLFQNEAYRAEFRQQFHRELDLPNTLDEYLDIARFFTRDTNRDGLIDLYGTTLMAGKHEANFVDYKSFLSNFGGELFDEKLRPAFHSEAGVKALETYGKWILAEKVTPPDVLSYSWDEVEIAFGYGQAVMGMNYHDMKLQPNVGGQVGYFMFPGVERGGALVRGPHFGSWGLAVNKYSRHKAEAFELADYLTSAEVQRDYLRFRQHVTRKSAYAAAGALPDESLREYYDVLGRSLNVGVGRPRIRNYDQVSEAVQTAVQQYLTGKKSARAALNAAAAKVEQSMRDNGYLSPNE